jgi:uncharacterized protein (DUF1499 family)
MNPLAWLVSLALPACGYPAAEGLPIPSVIDMAHIVRPSSPNTALAAPAGFSPVPDIVTQPYHVPPNQLFGVVQAVAGDQPNTFKAALYPDQLQAHYVARSVVFNFPDLITVQVRQDTADTSDVIIWSRSVYGESDFGVNRKRVQAWLGALDKQLPPPSER